MMIIMDGKQMRQLAVIDLNEHGSSIRRTVETIKDGSEVVKAYHIIDKAGVAWEAFAFLNVDEELDLAAEPAQGYRYLIVKELA